MSRSDNQPESEHGSIKFYVTGFILSLIFTFIPYFMVVNQTISGTLLLTTILGFAVVQMLIQLTFFLHLGRGPKPRWNLFFFVATVGVILIVVGGSIMIINNLHYNMTPTDQLKKLVNDEGIYQIGGEKTGACQGQHANHQVTIKNGQLSPLRSVTSKCDTLTFINQDGTVRKFNFGPYPQHKAYAGENDLSLRKGMNQTLTLSEPGTYQFYDQSHPEISGDFTVVP